MNLYQDIFNLLESKTSKAFRAMDAQMELFHREKHGRPRTKKERQEDRKGIGAQTRSQIGTDLTSNDYRNNALSYWGIPDQWRPSTTRSRIELQNRLYKDINDMYKEDRRNLKGKGKG